MLSTSNEWRRVFHQPHWDWFYCDLVKHRGRKDWVWSTTFVEVRQRILNLQRWSGFGKVLSEGFESVVRKGFRVLYRWRVGSIAISWTTGGDQRLLCRWDWKILICTENVILVKQQDFELGARTSYDFMNHRHVHHTISISFTFVSHTCNIFLLRKFN